MNPNKPASSQRFPSIVITQKGADLLHAYGTACSAVGAAQGEVESLYTAYLQAKHDLVEWLQALEDSSPLVTDQSHNYTRIRF